MPIYGYQLAVVSWQSSVWGKSLFYWFACDAVGLVGISWGAAFGWAVCLRVAEVAGLAVGFATISLKKQLNRKGRKERKGVQNLILAEKG